MGQFVLSMVSFNVYAEVQPVEVRNPECISITKGYKIRIVKSEGSYWIGNRSSGLIHEIGRKTVALGKPIVGN